jgi:hypothetical protein
LTLDGSERYPSKREGDWFVLGFPRANRRRLIYLGDLLIVAVAHAADRHPVAAAPIAAARMLQACASNRGLPS